MKRRKPSLIKQISVLLIGLYIFLSALIFLRKGERLIRKAKRHQKRMTDRLSLQPQTTTITYEKGCSKKRPNQTYKVCTELPFSKINCGPKYSRNKKKLNESFLVPDVVFFVWFGDSLKFNFFNYLALRSAAAIHQPERIDFYFSISLPIGKY